MPATIDELLRDALKRPEAVLGQARLYCELSSWWWGCRLGPLR